MGSGSLQSRWRVAAGFQTRKGVETRPDGTHLLLQIRDFDESRTAVDPSALARISPQGVEPDACLSSGDVLFLAKGARNFAYAVGDLPSPVLAASYFFVLRPDPGVSARYLAWFLNQDSARRHFVRLATTGAHMPVVRRDVLENLELPVPPVETQQKIVELAALADEQQRLLADLGERKKLLATAACLRVANESITNQDD